MPVVAFEQRAKAWHPEDRFSVRRLAPALTYVAVYDGHGGSEAADWCVANMPRLLMSRLRETSTADALARAFVAANKELPLTVPPTCGTTATIALVWGSRLLVTATVGDSRVVLCDGGEAVQLAAIHRSGDAAEVERIARSGGSVTGNGDAARVGDGLAVTRSIGDRSSGESIVPHPHIAQCTLGPSTEFLIIASDGLWDVCGPQEAIAAVRGLEIAGELAAALVQLAMRRWHDAGIAVDDITCGVVRLSQSRESEWSFESEMAAERL